MAGKSGGAWKVAYADFVTAMMAFFLVMWICAQDQKMKEAIARYFNNPLGVKPIGESSVPDPRSSIFHSPDNGEVPNAKAIQLGMGRNSYTPSGDPALATYMISNFIAAHDDKHQRFAQMGEEELQNASLSESPSISNRQAAARRLAVRIRQDFVGEMPNQSGIWRDLLLHALDDVNWRELAEDYVDQ